MTSPHGRYTFGLRHFLGQLGREHGEAAGERSAHLLGIQVTARAVLRFLHARTLPDVIAPQIIGLDDWAWKRRERYGAIIVDLERNRPIALLSDRSQKTVAQWLKRYPPITMVARDRSKEFAAAITEALPRARHIADRWHLAKNLTEHLDKVVSARWKQLSKVSSQVETGPHLISPSPSSRRPRQAPGEARYQQMLVLRESGLSTRIIAKLLGVTQRTIQHWLTKEHGPYAGARRPRRSPLDWSAQYLQTRWEAGERNGTVLWEELKAQGYTGSSRSVYRRLAAWRHHPRKSEVPLLAVVAPHLPFEGVTPGKVIGWMLARPETLSSKTREQFERITQMDDTLTQARELTRGFLNLIRHHNSKGLESWLNDVRASTLREFRLFARSLEQDKDAVLAGLALPVSHRACRRIHQSSQADQTRSIWSSGTLLLTAPLLACRLRRWHSQELSRLLSVCAEGADFHSIAVARC